MNWLINMFSEFSETVMGDSEAFERDRKSHRKKDRELSYDLKRGSRPKRRSRDTISDWDW